MLRMNSAFPPPAKNLHSAVHTRFGTEIDALDVKILLTLMTFCDVFSTMIFIHDCLLRCYIILSSRQLS